MHFLRTACPTLLNGTLLQKYETLDVNIASFL